MSARHRPQRRVRGRDVARIEARLIGWPVPYSLSGAPLALLRTMRRRAWWYRDGLRRSARELGCRPAQLRRCPLGLPVSARAAARILAAVSARRKSTGRHGEPS